MIYQKQPDGNWSSCAEFMGTNGNQTINGSLTIQGDSSYIQVGNKNNEEYSPIFTERKLFGESLRIATSLGGYNYKGYAQFTIDKYVNGYWEKQNRYLFNKDTFFPEFLANLGSTTNPFNNGYFKGKVQMGSESVVNATNDKAILNFNNTNNELCGQVGKLVENSNDMVIKSNFGNTRLQCGGEAKAQLGTATYGVEIYQGAKAWYFSPYGSINFPLGRDTNRWGTLYTTTSPNVSSDKTLKENIVYINDNTKANDLNKDSAYNFIRDDLKLAEYNMKSDKDKNIHIGFIAQDLENNLIGEKILTRDESNLLSYNQGNYTNILALALQKSIEKIEKLEQEIAALKNN